MARVRVGVRVGVGRAESVVIKSHQPHPQCLGSIYSGNGKTQWTSEKNAGHTHGCTPSGAKVVVLPIAPLECKHPCPIAPLECNPLSKNAHRTRKLVQSVELGATGKNAYDNSVIRAAVLRTFSPFSSR
jgi:hypothetical protein